MAVNTPVRKSGIRIGRVSEVKFAEGDKEVIVTIEIENGRYVYNNETCQATSPLFMGDSSLDIVRKPGPPMPLTALKMIAQGATIDGIVTEDAGRSLATLKDEATGTMRLVDATSEQLKSVLIRLDRILAANEQGVGRMLREMQGTMAVFDETLRYINEILSDPECRDGFKKSVKQMPRLIDATHESVKDMKKTFNHVEQSLGLLDDNLRNLSSFTKPLADNGESIVVHVQQSMGKLNGTMDELQQFSRAMNDPQGSLGQLMHDPEVYQCVSRTVRNVEELTARLKPILDDARVFSDKIARHPESLGVRGAIQPAPGIK